MSSIFAAPDPNALGPSNLTNGTATAVVPVSSDTSGEVQVHFVNSTITATLKICKYLNAGSERARGSERSTSTYSDARRSRHGHQHRRGRRFERRRQDSSAATPDTARRQFPVGSTITVTETGMPYVVGGRPADRSGRDPDGHGRRRHQHRLLPQQAYGQLEICKSMLKTATFDDGRLYNGITFNFSVDGSKTTIPVQSGHCSPPQLVPAGTHTVKEVNIPTGFQFVSSTATGPLGDNRATSARANGATRSR